jgi:hypothetical protein
MLKTLDPINDKISWRSKARLNICIAQDLADNFGGNKADYLKRLNQKLRLKIVCNATFYNRSLAKAA